MLFLTKEMVRRSGKGVTCVLVFTYSFLSKPKVDEGVQSILESVTAYCNKVCVSIAHK